jgi:hypothetical protein
VFLRACSRVQKFAIKAKEKGCKDGWDGGRERERERERGGGVNKERVESKWKFCVGELKWVTCD